MLETKTRFDGLEAHEVLAVLARLHDELETAANSLFDAVGQFGVYLDDAIDAIGKRNAADAGHAFYMDEDPENVAYLDSLVVRVKARADGDDA